MGGSGPVVRLVTSVDVDPAVGDDDRRMSIRARHEAELADGRRVLLLDDRGWGASGPPGIWARTSPEEIADTARTVVGPDEACDGMTPAGMAADHWADMARRLRERRVVVDPSVLAGLPHDVVMGEVLLRRVGGGRAERRRG